MRAAAPTRKTSIDLRVGGYAPPMNPSLVPLDEHYTDPLLVARYDADNSGRDDTDYYVTLADRLGARTVVDVGCGTGVLATELAHDGRIVVGVDPAAPMLEIARSRPGGGRVTWVEGTADAALQQVAPGSVDLVLMTGHVAQVFLTDEAWAEVLRVAVRLLAPGGRLAFETRDPDDAAWTRWTPDLTREHVVAADGTSSTSWVEVTSAVRGLVTFDGHTVLGDGLDRVSTSTLGFRTLDEICASLQVAGLETVTVHGDWDESPVGPGTSELVVVAAKP